MMVAIGMIEMMAMMAMMALIGMVGMLAMMAMVGMIGMMAMVAMMATMAMIGVMAMITMVAIKSLSSEGRSLPSPHGRGEYYIQTYPIGRKVLPLASPRNACPGERTICSPEERNRVEGLSDRVLSQKR